ncbi:MAG: NAD(P)-binding protein [Pseudomonadota bacterium]|nr:NAD(P)-binding protein [Pseudomonadota bacterium]
MKKFDTVIVGAGVSGLTAAIISASHGKSTLIIEKNHKVGGRLSSIDLKTLDGRLKRCSNGAMWVHDSTHPVMMYHGFQGRYDTYLKTCFLKGKFKALLDYYIVKPLTIHVFKHVFNILYNDETLSLDYTWDELLKDMIRDNPKFEITRKIRQSWYVKCLLSCLGQERFCDWFCYMFSQLELDVMYPHIKHYLQHASVIGSQNLSGVGDDHFLPYNGYHKVVDCLMVHINHYMASGLISIHLNKTCTRLLKHQGIHHVFTGNNCMSQSRRLVLALAPNHYQSMEFKGYEADQRVSHVQKNALMHLDPSREKLIIMILNKKIDVSPKGGDVNIGDLARKVAISSILTHGLSDCLYVISPISVDTQLIKKFVLLDINNHRSADDHVRLVAPLYENYTNGMSWFLHRKGFKPLVNTPSDDLLFLSCLTGCDDSVHSNITRACLEMGLLPRQIHPFLVKCFTPTHISWAQFLYRRLHIRRPNLSRFLKDFIRRSSV